MPPVASAHQGTHTPGADRKLHHRRHPLATITAGQSRFEVLSTVLAQLAALAAGGAR